MVLIPLILTLPLLSPDNDTLDWGVDDIDAERVWGGEEDATDVIASSSNFTGKNVNIAIIDTGIDMGHEDLYQNFRRGLNFADDQGRYNVTDTYGHGTHIAGIITAEDNDNGVIGVAPHANLYVLRAFTKSATSKPQWIIKALDWCIGTHKDDDPSNDIDIVSMSFGWNGEQDIEDFWKDKDEDGKDKNYFSYFKSDIQAAYQNDILLVAASGNENRNQLSCPANFSEVIAVGAINGQHHRWVNTVTGQGSNYGPGLELVTPGASIYSTTPSYLTDLIANTALTKYYGYYSGTSMAAPFVTGVAALIMECNERYNLNLKISEIREILRMSAVDLGTNGYDQIYGYGEVNAARAIDATMSYRKDTDGDGLTDTVEKYGTHTNYCNPDTDFDGLSDKVEVYTYDIDPLNPDTDNDFLIDGDEILTYHTNPRSKDTDKDGLSDYLEVISLHTNPLRPDTDGDGLNDGEEVRTYHTDPTTVDTDGDGYTDFEELTHYHTDPTDPTDVPFGGLTRF